MISPETGTIVPTLRSPDDTRGWVRIRTPAGEGWLDGNGMTWVRARSDETPELLIIFTRHGLAPRGLVRSDASRSVRRATRKARREARALKVRGLV
jgi:hypothetical protein